MRRCCLCRHCTMTPPTMPPIGASPSESLAKLRMAPSFPAPTRQKDQLQGQWSALAWWEVATSVSCMFDRSTNNNIIVVSKLSDDFISFHSFWYVTQHVRSSCNSSEKKKLDFLLCYESRVTSVNGVLPAIIMPNNVRMLHLKYPKILSSASSEQSLVLAN